ncbi:MAG TPA: phytanoyl-CoA dioxygenase family protein [Saprospiraceae bacterium]|nr:phytanoyl-CoA dioxygenase family protein [Saprospiraceae bacterium]
MSLTQDQIRFFRQVGYLKLRGRVSRESVFALKAKIEADIRSKIAPFKMNDNGEIIRLSALIDRNSIFFEVFTSSEVLDPLESLLGPNIELVRNRHNHATVNAKGHSDGRLHRDVLQWSRDIVTIILYLENSTIDNGCTHIIPSSQYFPFVGKPNNGGTWMDEHSIYKDFLDQSLPIPMNAGDILVIDSLMFHAVGLNSTDKTRMSITMGYRSVDELSRVDDPKLLLVRGQRIYKGNDR